MPLTDDELERLEYKYLEEINTYMNREMKGILEDLRSRIRIIDEWYDSFRRTAREGYNASDLHRGGERVIGHYLTKLDWNPISAPVGSDFMYETEEAIIHIEVKTALVTNPADYKNKIDIGENQTSYKGREDFDPKLPKYYYRGRTEEKPCLTYVVFIVNVDAKTILHNNYDQNPVLIFILSIPNGQLYSIYGSSVGNAGKGSIRKLDNKKGDFRYNYKKGLLFETLHEYGTHNGKRIRVPYYNDFYNGKEINGLVISLEKLLGIKIYSVRI